MSEAPAVLIESEADVQMYEIEALSVDQKILQSDKILAKSINEAAEIAMLEGLLMGAPLLRIGPLSHSWRILLRVKKFQN